MRAPGMSLNRMPLFVWAQLITSFMIIFAMPAVMLCSTMLSMDRLTHISTHFYNPAEGGDRAALAASVLVLRASRGLHHLHPRDGVRLDDRADVLPADDVRLHGAGAVAGRDGVHRLRRVGASHVRHAAAAAGPGAVHRVEPDDRHSQRRPDVLLDRDALGGRAALETADAVCARVHRDLHDRRIDGRDARVGVNSICRCTTRFSSSRICITC